MVARLDHVVADRRHGAILSRRSDDALDAIRTVAAGDSVLAPAATRRLLERFTPLLADGAPGVDAVVPAGITGRELEVFRHVATGRSNREIAAELHVSEGTVKVHVSRLLGKLGVRDRVQAVVRAYELGIVRPGGLPKE